MLRVTFTPPPKSFEVFGPYLHQDLESIRKSGIRAITDALKSGPEAKEMRSVWSGSIVLPALPQGRARNQTIKIEIHPSTTQGNPRMIHRKSVLMPLQGSSSSHIALWPQGQCVNPKKTIGHVSEGQYGFLDVSTQRPSLMFFNLAVASCASRYFGFRRVASGPLARQLVSELGILCLLRLARNVIGAGQLAAAKYRPNFQLGEGLCTDAWAPSCCKGRGAHRPQQATSKRKGPRPRSFTLGDLTEPVSNSERPPLKTFW